MGKLVVSNVSKVYKRYSNKWIRISEWLFGKSRHEQNWVLRDIQFTVNAGESVGIVGVNGAGKSTLLKIITGTTKPTRGTVHTEGRVAALLELGMGFHPDFTGRQNVFMAGQLLGLKSDEISSLMPAIEDFAEIGEYIDQPLRMFSSGMQMRLAFGLATAVRPDLLIVDEALSVGDVQFQQKCMARIRDFREQGTTILLVTHDIGALSVICERSLLLSEGKIIFDGPVSEGIEAYFSSIARGKGDGTSDFVGHFESPSAYLAEWKLTGSKAGQDIFCEGDKMSLILRMKGLDRFSDPHIGIRIQNRYGLIAFETNTFCQGLNPRKQLGDLSEFEVEIKLDVNLGYGEYTLAIGIENEGLPGGMFKSVIIPTQIFHRFRVSRDPNMDRLWAGFANLNPRFGVKSLTVIESD